MAIRRNHTDYRYIRAWGRMMNSMAYYINDQVHKARHDNAPEDAIYYDDRHECWRTYRDIESATTRDLIDRFVGEVQ